MVTSILDYQFAAVNSNITGRSMAPTLLGKVASAPPEIDGTFAVMGAAARDAGRTRRQSGKLKISLLLQAAGLVAQ